MPNNDGVNNAAGEIRWYQFRRPGKRRPVLILTRDSALAYLVGTTIALITGIGEPKMEEARTALLFAGGFPIMPVEFQDGGKIPRPAISVRH